MAKSDKNQAGGRGEHWAKHAVTLVLVLGVIVTCNNGVLRPPAVVGHVYPPDASRPGVKGPARVSVVKALRAVPGVRISADKR